MNLRDSFKTILGIFQGVAAASRSSEPTPEEPASAPDEPQAREDMQLTPRVSLCDLTRTDHAEFQAQNRVLTNAQIAKLRALAALAERVMDLLGQELDFHSGYRCPALNAAIGSGETSQHPKCEALDWTIKGALDSAGAAEAPFIKLRGAMVQGQLKVGQIIIEAAKRGYAKTFWVHISLGVPYRDPQRCGEVLRMVQGTDGKLLYTLIDRVPEAV